VIITIRTTEDRAATDMHTAAIEIERGETNGTFWEATGLESDMSIESAESIAERIAATVSAYQDSAEEVNDPEGQPIVETFPQLRALLIQAVERGRE
jgi:hypothetical protein